MTDATTAALVGATGGADPVSVAQEADSARSEPASVAHEGDSTGNSTGSVSAEAVLASPQSPAGEGRHDG